MMVMVKLNYIWLKCKMFIEYGTEFDFLPWKLKKCMQGINKEELIMMIPNHQSTYSGFCYSSCFAALYNWANLMNIL